LGVSLGLSPRSRDQRLERTARPPEPVRNAGRRGSFSAAPPASASRPCRDSRPAARPLDNFPSPPFPAPGLPPWPHAAAGRTHAPSGKSVLFGKPVGLSGDLGDSPVSNPIPRGQRWGKVFRARDRRPEKSAGACSVPGETTFLAVERRVSHRGRVACIHGEGHATRYLLADCPGCSRPSFERARRRAEEAGRQGPGNEQRPQEGQEEAEGQGQKQGQGQGQGQGQ
jgi:hypothetical protein